MHLPFADESGREARRTPTFAGGATQNQSVAAVLDNRLRVAVAVYAGDLGDGLKAEDAAPAKLPQAGKRVLEAVDRPECIELIDDEPELLITFTLAHRFKDREAEPSRNH